MKKTPNQNQNEIEFEAKTIPEEMGTPARRSVEVAWTFGAYKGNKQ